MPTHHDTQHSPYTTRQLFDMVADVPRYPEFLPWCRAARVLERGAAPGEADGSPQSGDGWFLGELVISFKGLTESYISRVTLTPPEGEGRAHVDVRMVSGPFTHLVNEWEFTPEAGGTRIDFRLDFSFRSKLLERMMGGLFTKAQAKMAEAFKKRADTLYGGPAGA